MTWIAEILIDGTVVWSSQVAAAQSTITIDISAYTGVHTLMFRLRRLS